MLENVFPTHFKLPVMGSHASLQSPVYDHLFPIYSLHSCGKFATLTVARILQHYFTASSLALHRIVITCQFLQLTTVHHCRKSLISHGLYTWFFMCRATFEPWKNIIKSIFLSPAATVSPLYHAVLSPVYPKYESNNPGPTLEAEGLQLCHHSLSVPSAFSPATIKQRHKEA